MNKLLSLLIVVGCLSAHAMAIGLEPNDGKPPSWWKDWEGKAPTTADPSVAQTMGEVPDVIHESRLSQTKSDHPDKLEIVPSGKSGEDLPDVDGAQALKAVEDEKQAKKNAHWKTLGLFGSILTAVALLITGAFRWMSANAPEPPGRAR
ncbi:MAG: hypothetical protein HUU60_02070 [Armatimonadetes bacterium]|nr:hypothetical protein [Armatimonadota bacterium]